MLQTWRLGNSNRLKVEEFLSVLGETIQEEIIEQSRSLCQEYAKEWGAGPEADLSVHSQRVAIALAYHWWRLEGNGTTTKEQRLWSEREARARRSSAIEKIRSGEIYSTEEAQRLRANPLFREEGVPDVLLEVAFVEEVCQRPSDPKIIEEFHKRYDRTAQLLIELEPNPLAKQELEGLLPEVWMPREVRLPRLANFNGTAPLAAWLRKVLKNKASDSLKKRTKVETLSGDELEKRAR